MVYEIIGDTVLFTSAGFFDRSDNVRRIKKLLWGDEPILDWNNITLRCTDPSLPEPDFMFLNMAGIFLTKPTTIQQVQNYFVGSQFLPVTFNGQQWLIIKPPSCIDCIELSETVVRYEEEEVPIISTPVFKQSLPVVPWLFRFQHCILLYAKDGPGSFLEWYTNSGFTGLKFIPQASAGSSKSGKNPEESRYLQDDFECHNFEQQGTSTDELEKDATITNFPITLNLQDEESIIYPHLVSIFSEFHKVHSDARVCAIEIYFNTDPGGYFINIDTRDKHTIGTWNEMEYSGFGLFNRDLWFEFKSVMMSSCCSLMTYTGDILEFIPAEGEYQLVGECANRYKTDEPDGGHLIMALGEFLTCMMKKLISQGVFNGWNLAPNSRFYVGTVQYEFHTHIDSGFRDNIINQT